ncbi:putative glycosyltransferase-like [Dorcoceras hygrometricum]|uniref:Putative glycosyltransferase-like n=1 Tax=Dorcoceras hygrometricum TaxID=472368 RepID=A0A2Z7B283_9LAMI|nr:putative glycosyltransferase-like [Dorcoceras hygrometricum]
MASSSSVQRLVFFNTSLSRRLRKDSSKGPSSLIFLPFLLAFATPFLIFFHSSSAPKLNNNIIPSDDRTRFHAKPFLDLPNLKYPHSITQVSERGTHIRTDDHDHESPPNKTTADLGSQESAGVTEPASPVLFGGNTGGDLQRDQWRKKAVKIDPTGSMEKKDDVFHDRRRFIKEYSEMNGTLKIFWYPHKRNDPFANVLVSVDSDPGGNYASESYFKKSLLGSHFLTDDPSEADLFYLPFSIASLRHDKRIGVHGIKDFVKNYVRNISRDYPYWNRTGGADHFYVACHSVGRSATEKAVEVKLNAIQVVCSSSYFLQGYIAHKDASIPQIWPRKGKPPVRLPSQRKNLAFYAGAMNSRVRKALVEHWEHDTNILVHRSRLKTPYSEALLGSKYCIHAKGFEVNTARIGDALYYGCVPVILADHYDLPYADILNWNRFSVIVAAVDIPFLKEILQKISFDEYLKLQNHVMKVQKHFQWHHSPVDFDAFYMVMFELWLRRSHVRLPIF